jgi:ABC-type glycerol-3-phosphate transport system permease component
MYQGLWCKLLGRAARHRKIVEATPFLNSFRARYFLVALGIFECVLAAWALSGLRQRGAAVVQTVLLISMNTVALFRARNLISDPPGMLLQNCAFLILTWIAAGQFDCYAAGSVS